MAYCPDRATPAQRRAVAVQSVFPVSGVSTRSNAPTDRLDTHISAAKYLPTCSSTDHVRTSMGRLGFDVDEQQDNDGVQQEREQPPIEVPTVLRPPQCPSTAAADPYGDDPIHR
jgi:hypothetical protein